MALINCPECGRGKVSDMAASCPDCGYGIKEHFDIIKQEKAMQRANNKEAEKQKFEYRRIETIPMPPKPVFSKGLIAYMIIVTMIFIYVFAINLNNGRSGYAKSLMETWIFPWILLLFILVVMPLAAYTWSFFNNVRLYELSQIDFKLYQKKILERKEKYKGTACIDSYEEEPAPVIRPKCPYCESKNTTRITTGEKVVNIALFGIFGQKRKHQWHCDNCNSNF